MTKHHTIITGTGRAGTTFLMQLFTSLGLETGFDDPTSSIDPNSNAGMEWDIRKADAPYIVKSPWLCDYLGELLDRNTIVIDHAIIPVRDLLEAAESRRDVSRRVRGKLRPWQIHGGLWHTDRPAQQESVLTTQLYKIIHAITKADIPLTLLYFPRLINDPEYLYRKLDFLLKQISYDSFLHHFNEIAQPKLVHRFGRSN
jgi:hypothetical protein